MPDVSASTLVLWAVNDATTTPPKNAKPTPTDAENGPISQRVQREQLVRTEAASIATIVRAEKNAAEKISKNAKPSQAAKNGSQPRRAKVTKTAQTQAVCLLAQTNVPLEADVAAATAHRSVNPCQGVCNGPQSSTTRPERERACESKPR